jgi:hypothetical protein
MSAHRSRTDRPDLLVRPPGGHDADHWWQALVVDPVTQLEALVELRRRGLLTVEEFNRQKAKVLA